MALFKIFKGLSSNLIGENSSVRYAHEGFAYFTPDDGKFYIDTAGDNTDTVLAEIGINRIPLNASLADKSIAANLSTVVNSLPYFSDANGTFADAETLLWDNTNSLLQTPSLAINANSNSNYTLYVNGSGCFNHTSGSDSHSVISGSRTGYHLSIGKNGI